MKSHLKVKVFSLSAEMTYIRRQEEKWKTKARIARQKKNDGALTYCENNFWSLRQHRVFMKPDARNTHLAYGFMKGRRYAEMEPLCYGVLKGYGGSEPQWGRIAALVSKFGADEQVSEEYIKYLMQKFAEWEDDAKKWYEGNKERIPAAWVVRKLTHSARMNDPVYLAEKKKRSQMAECLGRAAADM